MGGSIRKTFIEYKNVINKSCLTCISDEKITSGSPPTPWNHFHISVGELVMTKISITISTMYVTNPLGRIKDVINKNVTFVLAMTKIPMRLPLDTKKRSVG